VPPYDFGPKIKEVDVPPYDFARDPYEFTVSPKNISNKAKDIINKIKEDPVSAVITGATVGLLLKRKPTVLFAGLRNPQSKMFSRFKHSPLK